MNTLLTHKELGLVDRRAIRYREGRLSIPASYALINQRQHHNNINCGQLILVAVSSECTR